MSGGRAPGDVPAGKFPKRARVRKRREYLTIQESGRRVSTASFLLIVAARADGSAEGPRLGVVASRKVGNAVARSRAKRLVREGFRAARDLFPSDIDVVVIVRRLPPEFGLQDVTREWRAANRQLARRVDEARLERPQPPTGAAAGSGSGAEC